MDRINILGIRISNLTTSELLLKIKKEISSNNTSLMLSANVHSINLSHKYLWFKNLINNSEIVRNDSAGVLLAGKILGTPIKERMTWADFGWNLADYCEKENISLYFLGDKPGIAEKARTKIQKKHVALNIIETHHGYFEKIGQENEEVIRKINQLKPDILIVGLGMPLQEKWILENKPKLKVGLIITGGNCFSFLSGEETRAPLWMHRNGLEWMFRLIKEPKRMFNRYIIGNPLFLFRVLKHKFRKY